MAPGVAARLPANMKIPVGAGLLVNTEGGGSTVKTKKNQTAFKTSLVKGKITSETGGKYQCNEKQKKKKKEKKEKKN